MSRKKKRQKLYAVRCVLEGEKREKNLLSHLKFLYLDESKINFTEDPRSGGNPDRLLDIAIKQLSFADKIFVWLDEDVDFSQTSKVTLLIHWKIDKDKKEEFLNCAIGKIHQYNIKNRNPTLIVSQPVCVEALILRILGKKPCHMSIKHHIRKTQIKDLKNSLNGVIGKKDESKFFNEHLTKELLDSKRKEIPELNLLISMLLK